MRMNQLVEGRHGKEQDFHPKQATLCNLPHDLLLHIFQMCNAQTVAKLRQCCKEFSELSNEQIVWLEVLKRTCADVNLSIPSFPQNTGPGSRADIELFSTAWLRFQSVLRRAQDGHSLPHKIIRHIHVTEHILSLKLSPDGRFLFFLHNTGIQVWSVGTVSPHLAHSFAVKTPNGCRSSLYLETESNGSIILYLLMNGFSPRLKQLIALRFSFPPHGLEGIRLDLLSQLNCLSFSALRWGGICWKSTFLVTYFEHPSEGRCCLLWNPVEDTCATWVSDAMDTSNKATYLIIRGFIISFDKVSHAMVVYPLPEIPPKHTYAPEKCARLNNPAVFRIPAQTERIHYQLVTSLSWESSSTDGYATSDCENIAMICDDMSGNWLLEQVALCRTASSSSPLKVEHSPLLRIPDPYGFPIPKTMAPKIYIYPSQSHLLHAASEDRTQIVFHLNALSENRNRIEIGMGVLYDSDNVFIFDKRTYSLAPFAGRLTF
ncbi:hypothetical protein DL96DRAFT_269822 [Flagelloscypha sp. PMI_526]|nr:hypothetical protein DL96DRAFT_269822 [Flagelloscypha sp. PMI_526]